ncbi:MAG TPA: hypothetical protein DCS66_10100, partial [Flavobacteriaceae bacterium]|nr:hypothetical protein [Flavobacteriaceae bacterium]
MVRKRIPLLVNYALSGQHGGQLIFSENPTVFEFDSPWLKSAGVKGLTKYYQAFLSAGNPSDFFSGSLSSTPLSSVNYFATNRVLSARFPAFSGFNVIDFGGNVVQNYSKQTISIDLTALSGKATGPFKIIITAPGGQTEFPGCAYGYNTDPNQ